MISSQVRLTQLFIYCLLVLIWAIPPAIGEVMSPGPFGKPASPQLQQDNEVSDRVSVLVHLQPPGKDVSAQASQRQRQGVKDWAASMGGKVKHEYNVVLPHVLNLRNLPRESLHGLQMIPGVVKIEEDRIMKAHLTVSTPLVQGLQNQITSAGYSADGNGIRVCVIDTGIDSDHIMYADRVDTAAGKDFINNDDNPEDDNGHGTNVAGIILGGTGLTMTRCGESTDIQGIAPEATLIGIKVLDAVGSGLMSDVIEGINYCADQSDSGGRSHVINLSLGGGQFSGNCDEDDTTAQAANNAVDLGVIVVASSGNDAFENAMGTPACGSKVIAVGAVYDDDFENCEYTTQYSFSWCADSTCSTECTDNSINKNDLICFSNRSETIDVVAPGCVITSAAMSSENNTSISGMCGTSQASPHVAGLAALLLSQAPELSPALIRQHIRDGAIDDSVTPGFDSGYGYGRIDVINTLSLLHANCDSEDECDDGLFCNGAEVCDPDIGCTPGSNPCTDVLECNEATDTCDIPICNNNGTCDAGEDCNNCPSDCISNIAGTDCSACFKGQCDGVCHPREIGTDCPDCSVSYCCGDGICEGTESSETCLVDCPAPSCGDGICEGAESSETCLADCPAPFCGDGICDSDETSCDCVSDCGSPPSNETNCTDNIDNDCDTLIDWADSDDCVISQSCLPRKDSCSTDDECCSGRCVRDYCK